MYFSKGSFNEFSDKSKEDSDKLNRNYVIKHKVKWELIHHYCSGGFHMSNKCMYDQNSKIKTKLSEKNNLYYFVSVAVYELPSPRA